MKRNILSLAVVGLAALLWGSARATPHTSGNAVMAMAVTDTVPTRKDTTRRTDTARRSDTSAVAVQAQAGTPDVVVSSFRAKYPDAINVTWSPYDRVQVPIDWEMTGWTPLDAGDYVVEFDAGGQHYYAWYDASGKWIGSSSMLANHGDLPKAVRDLLVKKYNGYTITKVEREYDDAGTKYEIKLKKGDDDEVKLHLSEQGAVLKEKKKD